MTEARLPEARRPEPNTTISHRRWTRWALLLFGFVGALAACGPQKASDSEPVKYFDALSQAYSADDIYGILDFYATGARIQNRAGEFGEATVAITDLLRSSHRDPDRRLLDVYVSEEGALVLIRRPTTEDLEAVVTSVDDGGTITDEIVYVAVGTLSDGLQSSPDVIAAYDDIYRRFALAWSSGDRDAVAALYSPDAVITVGLHGEISVGSTAISVESSATADTWTAIEIGKVRNAAEAPGAGGPALYLDPIGYGHDPRRAIAIYEVEQPDGCLLRIGVNWILGPDDTIARESRYFDVQSYRACFGDSPTGWWTGLQLPRPRDEIVSGVFASDGQTIDIHNGTPHLQSLLEWGLGRFQAAGLAEPRVDSVTFEPSRRCDGVAGRVVDIEISRDLFMCIYESDLCVDDDECLTFTQSARFGMLHELAHAWMLDAADDPARSRVLELSGRQRWNDRDVAWTDRGVEYAADAIAWGLAEEELALVRLGNPPCSEILAVFEALTGVSPPDGNKVCSD